MQGGPDYQHRVFDGTVRALKWLFLPLLGELKDLVSVKNHVAGGGGGGLDLCQGGPGIYHMHLVRDSNPPRKESQGVSHPGGYSRHQAKDGPK